MILAVDIRNGGVAIGVVAREGTWKTRFRLSAAERSADEWAYLILAMIRERGIFKEEITQGILSSVVPAYTPVFYQALTAILPSGETPLVVGPGIKTGLRIRTDTPSEVGSDLVCNAVAALSLCKPPCIVIDFSTVLSFVALDGAGDLPGVALVPGLETAATDLRFRAAQIPQVRLEEPQRAIGKNTAESIRAGIMIGWAGLVDRLVETIGSEIAGNSGKVSIVGTGPYLKPPVKTTTTFDVWNPDLALEGLYLIAQKNQCS